MTIISQAGTNSSFSIDDLVTPPANPSQGILMYSISGSFNLKNSSGISQISNLTMGGPLILNADPTESMEAATKQYVDAISAGITFKTPCYASSTVNLSVTYDNGASGVGATLTNAGAQAVFTIDGQTPPINSRILIKNQGTTLQNGIYVLSDIGSVSTNWVLTRAADYDQPSETFAGSLVPVINGNSNASTSWLETAPVTDIGTDPIIFVQFTYGSGIVNSVSGTTNRITSSGGQNPVIDIASTYAGQTSITTLGTVTSGTWNATLLGMNYGGLNAALTAANGGIFYSTASSGAILAPTATANQMLKSGANGAPSWSTTTWPTTSTINQILYSSAANTISGIASANNGALVTNGSGVPSISSTLPSAVTSNITTLGTISSIGSPLGSAYGGTGMNNGSATITLGGALVFSGAFTTTFTVTNNTTLTLPTTGTLATTSQIPSLPLSMANGGTAASLSASNGGIFYSTATTGAILGGTPTARQVLLSGLSSAPAWSSATYPDTTTANQILYSASNNTVTGLSTGNNGVLITSGAGVPSISSTLPSAVQGNITTVGTVTSGTWSAGTIAVARGGTNSTTALTNGKLMVSSGGAIIEGTSSNAPSFPGGVIVGNYIQRTMDPLDLPQPILAGSSIAVKFSTAIGSSNGITINGAFDAYTLPVAGTYLATFNVYFDEPVAADVGLYVVISGSTRLHGNVVIPQTAVSGCCTTIVTTTAPNQTLQFGVYAGANAKIIPDFPDYNYAAIRLISAV